MDTFMDKLASRFNAQEMIRANSAAEAAESEKLKKEVEVYKQCLEQMREISSQNAATGDEVAALVKASMDKIAAIRVESNKSDEILLAMKANADEMTTMVKANSDEMVASIQNAVRGAVRSSTEALVTEVQAKNDDVKNQITENITEYLRCDFTTELKREMKAQDENVHKECVKVYRNVQAAVAEENERQTDTIVENQTKIRKRATAALVCGILAMSFSALHLLLTILDMLGILSYLF